MRTIIVVAVTFLALAHAPAQTEWKFRPAPPGHLHGPGFWAAQNNASFVVSCLRFNQDISPNPRGNQHQPILSPRRLEVAVVWIGRNWKAQDVPAPIVGTTFDPRARPLSSISFHIDGGRMATEKWETEFGYQQVVKNDEAVDFLRRLLPPARQLSVFADFTDDVRRTETFDLRGMPELLARMEPDCAKVRPLLGGTGKSR